MLSSNVQLYFIGFLLSAFGGYVPALGGLCNLAGLVVCLVALKRLSGENQHLNDAFRFEVYALVAAVCVLLAVILPPIMLLVSVASVVLSLLSQYHLFYGFEEIAQNLPFPQGRMRLCFTISIAGSAVNIALSLFAQLVPALAALMILVGVACSAAVAVFLFQFMQALKQEGR